MTQFQYLQMHRGETKRHIAALERQADKMGGQLTRLEASSRKTSTA